VLADDGLGMTRREAQHAYLIVRASGASRLSGSRTSTGALSATLRAPKVAAPPARVFERNHSAGSLRTMERSRVG
jgi:hypothetical protein